MGTRSSPLSVYTSPGSFWGGQYHSILCYWKHRQPAHRVRLSLRPRPVMLRDGNERRPCLRLVLLEPAPVTARTGKLFVQCPLRFMHYLHGQQRATSGQRRSRPTDSSPTCRPDPGPVCPLIMPALPRFVRHPHEATPSLQNRSQSIRAPRQSARVTHNTSSACCESSDFMRAPYPGKSMPVDLIFPRIASIHAADLTLISSFILSRSITLCREVLHPRCRRPKVPSGTCRSLAPSPSSFPGPITLHRRKATAEQAPAPSQRPHDASSRTARHPWLVWSCKPGAAVHDPG